MPFFTVPTESGYVVAYFSNSLNCNVAVVECRTQEDAAKVANAHNLDIEIERMAWRRESSARTDRVCVRSLFPDLVHAGHEPQ